MILNTEDYTIELIDERSCYTPNSADNVNRYDREYVLSRRPWSAHGVRVSSGQQPLASVIVLAGAGTGINEHSTLLRPEALFLAVGSFVVRLAIPSLDLIWSSVTDRFTCFGVHAIPDSTDFISHGEISIARVTDAGGIVWSGSGADIFTGGLTVLTDEVRVADFDERMYSFNLLTGDSRMI